MNRGQLPNITFDRTTGSHSLAAAGQVGVRLLTARGIALAFAALSGSLGEKSG